MTQVREHVVDKISRDHDYLISLVAQLQGMCTQVGERENCRNCESVRRNVCQSSVEQLIRNFVEVTLKHNLYESVYMNVCVPKAHRMAHMQAHVDIAEQLKSIRVIFSEDGNCILAIEGIDRVLTTLLEHFEEFDRPLEGFLLAAA